MVRALQRLAGRAVAAGLTGGAKRRDRRRGRRGRRRHGGRRRVAGVVVGAYLADVDVAACAGRGIPPPRALGATLVVEGGGVHVLGPVAKEVGVLVGLVANGAAGGAVVPAAAAEEGPTHSATRPASHVARDAGSTHAGNAAGRSRAAWRGTRTRMQRRAAPLPPSVPPLTSACTSPSCTGSRPCAARSEQSRLPWKSRAPLAVGGGWGGAWRMSAAGWRKRAPARSRHRRLPPAYTAGVPDSVACAAAPPLK
jgi:hypothetical protein